ncbi:MAG: hypothetical protein R2853_14720 [Thermomicrobiales bacterium]
MATYDADSRNKVLRLAKRGLYDEETIFGNVDAAPFATLHTIDGQPYAIYADTDRASGNTIPLHGHARSRTLLHKWARATRFASPSRIRMGIVLARSVFNHRSTTAPP